MSNGKYLIVSCDGGGIRGLLTSMLLQDLGQRTLDNVDLWSGTSAGSVLSLGLAGGLPIDELVEIYGSKEFCQQLFSPYEPDSATEAETEALRRSLGATTGTTSQGEDLSRLVDSMLFPLYSAAGRLAVMEKYLPELTLEQVWTKQHKRALIATLLLNQRLPDGRLRWLPTTLHNLPRLANSELSDGVTIVNACMASTALPLFWQAHELATGQLFADGGVFAANPATVTLASVVGSGVLGDLGMQPKNVFMLSVGTGFNPASYPIQDGLPAAYPWGILGWMWPESSPNVGPFPLLEAVSSSSVTIDTFQSEMFLGTENFRRADVDLGHDQIAANDCSAVPKMKEVAQRYLESPEWAAIKQWFETHFSRQ